MKKIFCVLSAFVLISPAFAQEKVKAAPKGNYFYVAPFDLFLNTLQLGYERKLRNHNSISLSGGFKLSENKRVIDKIGGNGEVQYRINLLYDKEAVNNLSVVKNYTTFAYFAPYVQYRYEQLTDNITFEGSPAEREISIVNSGSAGVGFGFRLTGNENRFTLDVFAGGGLKISDLNGKDKYADFLQVGYTGLVPKIGFRMGIAF